MAQRFYINTSKEATLLASVGSGDVTFNLSGSGMVNIPATPFTIRIDPDTASEEVCLVTAGSATSLTVTRGFDGTSTFSHSAGAKVRHVVVAEFFNKADAHVEASTNVHGLSGGAAVVGTTQTQTLTNKTVNSSVFDVAHSTSPAASQAYRAHADSATGRNGFTWDNSGGSSGKAFLARVAGVDKTYIEGDGDLVVGGTTVTTGITNTGAIDNTGTAHVTGAVDFDSTLNVDGNTTLGGTLAVTGTSTLTGDVTLPLPAAGATTRLTINGRTGSVLVVGRNQAGSTTSRIYETGQTEFNGKAFIHDLTSPVVARVASTAAVPSPTAGVIIFDDSDSFIKRYNGATWDIVAHYRIAGGGKALYSRSTNQSIPDNTITKVAFTVNDNTNADITKNGSNNEFTLNRAGWWRITFNASLAGDADGLVRAAWIAENDDSPRFGMSACPPGGFFVAHSVSICRPFAASAVVSAYLYHDAGNSLDTIVAQGPVNISFEWVSPL